MMVLPVTCATASMTWPISTSRKLGVMRWPLLCALTTAVTVNASMTVTRVARIIVLIITLGTRAPKRGLRVLLFICRTSFVPGRGLGRGLIRGNHAIATVSELLCFRGDLRHIQDQLLLAAVPGDTDP